VVLSALRGDKKSGVYSCSTHEIRKIVISQGKFAVNRPFDYAQGMLLGKKHDLKKQTQFAGVANWRKVNYNKGIREINWIGHLVKTNPIQSQTQTE